MPIPSTHGKNTKKGGEKGRVEYRSHLAGLDTADGIIDVLKLNESLSETGHHSNIPGETVVFTYYACGKRLQTRVHVYV